MPETLNREYFRRQGARGGRIGGKLRMKSLSPAERTALGKKAVAAREKKRKARKVVLK